MNVIKNNFLQPKKVELSELFFDVIFVYAISKIAHTILHLHHGEVSLDLFLKYMIMTFVFTTIWSYQTFYTNRFGMVRPKDVGFMMFNMFVVIYLANSLYPDFEKTFFPFVLCSAILFLSIGVQYAINWFEVSGAEKKVCEVFGITMLICSVLSFIALVVPASIHYYFYFTAIGIGMVGPLFGRKLLMLSPVNAGHLIERYSLLTIIMFGEVMIGLASTVSIKHFDIMTAFQFGTVVFLFWIYWLLIDYFMDHHLSTAGFTLCYTHFLIFLGLGMFNAAIVFSENNEVHSHFKVNLMYIALLLVFGGILINMRRYKMKYRDKKFAVAVLLVWVAGYIISTFIHLEHALTVITFFVLMIEFALFMRKRVQV